MAFIKRQLRKVQKGQHVNSLGILEIPAIALEEALINAIVHRNYFIQVISGCSSLTTGWRLSAQCLPNTLSVEAIKTGVHMARNPILLSHIKDIRGIPYRGIGMGVARMIASCRESGIALDFFNEVEKSQFRVVFWRDEMLA